MSVQPNTDLASRITTWFLANRGRRVKVSAGAYAFDHNEVPEGTRLSTVTTIGASFETSDRALDERTIVVKLGEPGDDTTLRIAPGDLIHFEFGSQGRELLRLYFGDMAYVELLVVE